ncbi:hypothetical protein LCGC14_0978520 [marine sediment metagenome]|uniref:Uncharacterized protein n=1 Tax=marine sediment metagenome TaxID=412755 RepID=A0A0F9N9H3_9ZZZZ
MKLKGKEVLITYLDTTLIEETCAVCEDNKGHFELVIAFKRRFRLQIVVCFECQLQGINWIIKEVFKDFFDD